MYRKSNEASERIQALPMPPKKPGVVKTGRGYQFTLVLPEEKESVLLLYRKGEEKPCREIVIDGEKKMGNLASVLVEGISPEKYEYNYRMGDEIRQDPYAIALSGADEYGSEAARENPHRIRCGFGSDHYRWQDQDFTPKSFSDMILYKVQVRSFTMHKKSGVRAKGSFKGLEQKIPYLKDLGVTAVLLMPAYDYREITWNKHVSHRMRPYGDDRPMNMEEKPARINTWGYTGEACYFAPKASFTNGDKVGKEFSHMVDVMHQADIECLMEFYFDGSVSPSMMLDILHYWKREYHIDGFHLIGNGICQELFVRDPLLGDTKLIFDHVNGNELYHGGKPYKKTAAEYNDEFLYCMRHVLKGDEDMMREFIFRNRRNPDENSVINYMADQNGFTVMDMVSYEEKHNEKNGEENRDGAEYNCSWNCGEEGPSRKKNIRELRMRQLKNAFSLLLLSQGVPMIFQGDEFGNSQQGNNNAWCQDNETGWVDWSSCKANQKLLSFVRDMIGLRKKYPILHLEKALKCSDYWSLGYPDISYHGSQAWYAPCDQGARYMGIMYCGDYGERKDEFLYTAYNLHWIGHEFALPHLAKGFTWKMVCCTSESAEKTDGKEIAVSEKRTIEIPPRTVAILIGKQETT